MGTQASFISTNRNSDLDKIIDFDNIKSENSTKLADAINQFNENTQAISQLTTAVLDFDKIKAEIASLANIDDLNNQIVASKANKANAAAGAMS